MQYDKGTYVSMDLKREYYMSRILKFILVSLESVRIRKKIEPGIEPGLNEKYCDSGN